MQIMFRIILCVSLKGLVLTKATQDISMCEKSDHHILNFKIDRSHSDSIARNEREVDKVTLANISIIPEPNESSLNKPTSLRAFVQFDSPFIEKVKDIFVTLRWNQPEFTDEIIQGYQVQCSFFEDFKETCDNKTITATKLEHTVHNLTYNRTYYFRVRAHTKIVTGPYTDLINVSTTHENPIPKLLVMKDEGIRILDVDLNIINFVTSESGAYVAYSIQEHRIYWITRSRSDLMTLKINENNITKIASFDYDLYDLCIDWVARNLYLKYYRSGYSYIVKFDLTMWENGIIKFEEISKDIVTYIHLNISPSMGILYFLSYNNMNNVHMMQQYHLGGKIEQIRLNTFLPDIYIARKMIIDNTNNETPLIYWLTEDRIFVIDIIVSTYNQILHNRDISDNMIFQTMTIDKTNIYILSKHASRNTLYALNKKYVSLQKTNATKYVKKVIMNIDKKFDEMYAFDKSSQPYPLMRCLTPYEKVYNFENVNATANGIIVNLPESVVKRGCKKYNLPTTIYTISVSCFDNNLNKSEKFDVLTVERYYEIQNLAPFTEYKLKFTLSNFYFDQLSINPFDSNVILIKTNSSKLNAPENISVLALTPTIAVVYWMPLKKVYCVAVSYEVHWKSVTLVNDTQQENKQFINVPKRMADGRFFTKINLSLPVQDYLIYMRVYPNNFSDFYNESLSKIVHRYSEPNNITLYEVDINSMDISWISNINLTIPPTLEYKENATEKWQATNYIKINNNEKNEEIIYHIGNLKSGTLYKFRLILRYPEYEENFTWPADERFTFSTFDSSLSKPTSLRAFVQFDSPFTEKVKDIFVTLRWNQPELTDEIIQGYQVQCSFFEDFKETCDDKNITAKKLEHTVHNLTSNTTYYFRVRAHTKIVNKILASTYTDLINVSTTHENPIPKFLLTDQYFKIFDLDLNISTIITPTYVRHVAYLIQEHRIFWGEQKDLMTLKINENSITQMASFDYHLHYIRIDWVARNLYFRYTDYTSYFIVKFDLTMWEKGIIKFEEILKLEYDIDYLIVSPSMGIIYALAYNERNNAYMMHQYHLDGKSEQIRINELFPYIYYVEDMIIDDMNNETPLIYWLTKDRIFVADINVSTYNQILHNTDISDNMVFETMTMDKTNIYILSNHASQYTLYILNKKYVSLNRTNAAKYAEKIIINLNEFPFKINSFDKSSQSYPPMRCLTPDQKVYNFENVNATANSIIVNLPEPVAKSGCKKYNLPTTIYIISVSHCLDNTLNKSEKFNVSTYERYYEIQNLTPFAEYTLKFTLSNFYFDQLSINPFDSNVITIKTNSGKLNAPEDISVLALTPTIAVVRWMPPKKLNCVVVTYEVHWKSITLVNDTQENKQFINVPKRTADGRFFTKINLSLPVQDYLIYVRVYPNNFSDFYNERLNKIVHIYTEPNNIILNEVDINSMNISWISNINLTVPPTLEYKENATEKWQTTNFSEMNYNKEIIYHIENLHSGTSYKFRLILKYLEYEVYFIWPADERFIFSTRDNKHDIPSTPEIIAKKNYSLVIVLFMLSFIVIVTIICICYFYYLHRQQRGNNVQFLPSTMTDMELAIQHEVPYAQFIYNTMLHCNPDECALTKIARKQITFTKLLGSGAFGMVFQGKVKNLKGSDTEISVAIKTLSKDASSHEKKNLLKEAKLMKYFQHKHIIRLLAICLDGDSPLLVLELMETDLLKYLRECRNLQVSVSLALRLQDLLAMCEDVARGCCYLEKLRFVHRDLACRNCLISSRNRENRIIKIGDFGLARDIYTDDYYRMKGKDLLPIRWMAPESLMIEIFTSQSDVWSFGVLMWEITSLGEKPYIDKTDNEVIYHVRAGGRLPMSLNCPPPLYQLMLRCWSAADARPDFKFCLKNIIALRKNMEDTLLSPVDTI